MAKAYGPEAVELARQLYLKYGGKNFDAIQAEMQRQYPGWRKLNLVDRKRHDARGRESHGWVTKYGFERSLELYSQKLAESVNDDEQDLYLGIKTIRQSLQKLALAKSPSKDDLAKYRDFCKLEIEARRNLDLSRDNLETFVSGYEKLLIWLGELDPDTAKRLIKNGDRLIEMAQAHYGKPEEVDDGAGDREDEGGE
jgi:hypothetical protein